MTEQLRELAKALREKAAQAQAAKQEKCASIVTAAVGLQYLKNKLGI